MLTPVAIGSLWFLLEKDKLKTPKYNGQYTFRSASLLKPLYMWAASELYPYSEDIERWQSLAEPAVINSDNKTTTKVWTECGSEKILQALAQKTDLRWQFMEGYNTWGSIEIDAYMVCQAYTKLALSKEKNAKLILTWMRNLNLQHTFGVKEMLRDYLNIGAEKIAMKTGWDIDENEDRLRTHILALCEIAPNEVLGFVILTAQGISRALKQDYLSEDPDGDEVLNFHLNQGSVVLQGEIKNLLKAVKYSHQ